MKYTIVLGPFLLSVYAGHFSKNANDEDINIELASPSLQPFTKEHWTVNQQYITNTKRKRATTIHVSDTNGRRVQGATMTIVQVSKDFPFGSAIANTILGNLPYQNWFVKRFNVVEACSDVNSTVDACISRLGELKHNGVSMGGIGLESHFTIPNLPLFRGILDKFATLDLPIWLTEVDISNKLGKDAQTIYLEEVFREGFSHPSVNGVMLWTALHAEGCYEMCLTDNDFRNLPAGDVVDKLLQEWQTGLVKGVTDEHGSFSFYGFLGEYRISVRYANRITDSTFSFSGGEETKHFTIRL